MSDVHLVTYVALVLGIVSFMLYLWDSLSVINNRPVDEARRATEAAAKVAGGERQAAAAAVPTADDITKLLEAIAKVTDSLAKAGPGLTSFIAAVLFLAIATVSSGALRSPSAPSPAPQRESAAQLKDAPPVPSGQRPQ